VTARLAAAPNHAEAMDSMYRWTRHVYDLTRKYYLLGRDRMIRELDLPRGGSVLEMACGTGRNLAVIARAWPKAELYGMDISAEMLKSASATLGSRAALAQGEAAGFDPSAAFGRAQFDRVTISFATSMIPVWEAAVSHALTLVAPGGSLHIVDFGDMAELPRPLGAVLRKWLTRFHVTPRHDLAAHALTAGAKLGMTGHGERGMGGYYQLVTLRRPMAG
jgi:S-adenosylmethionine-diacylgycerolhomoserine-N-methlytransferase